MTRGLVRAMVAALLLSFAIALAAGVPVALAMGISSVVAVLADGFLPLEVVAQTMFTGVSSFPMLAIPFFILAADLMTAGRMTETLIRFANDLMGHIRGALGHVNILVSMLFGGLSGSALADATGPGAIIMRMMRAAGYDKHYSGALTAASAMITPLIPPSIPLIMYALSEGKTSIVTLFIAGIVPGLITTIVLMLMNYGIATKRGYGSVGAWPGRRAVMRSMARAIPALMMPIIILVGIRGGIMTATEAAAVAVAYAGLVGLVTRQLAWKDLPSILLRSGLVSSTVLLLVSMGSAFAWMLAYGQVPQQFAAWVTGITTDPRMVLMLVFVVTLLTGMFVDTIPAILILVPVLSPLTTRFGIDPVQMALVVVLTIVLGMLTPPVAPLGFAVSSVGRLRFERVAIQSLPFVVAQTVVIGLVILFPDLVTALPRLLGL